MRPLMVASPSSFKPALLCALWLVISHCGDLAFPADRIWKANTRQVSRVAGELRGRTAQELCLKQIGGTTDEKRWPLDSLDRLELPHLARRLPGVGFRQFQLANGDLLHARLPAAMSPDSPARSQDLILSGAFATALVLPWNGLHAISQSPNTNCVGEFDFETASPEWHNNSKNIPCVFDSQYAQSGQRSLKCSSDQKWVRYALPRKLAEGAIQFSFFVEHESQNSGRSIVRLQFAAPSQVTHQTDTRATSANLGRSESGPADQRAEISLSSSARYIDATISRAGQGSEQRLLKHSGWHTLTCQFSATDLAIMIDGNQLINRQFPAKSAVVLDAVEFVSGEHAAPVWIDDFALLEPAPVTRSVCLQRVADEVHLQGGDQLFGRVQDVGLAGVRLASSNRETLISWARVAQVFVAEHPIEVHPIAGWICRVELQPVWTAPDWRQSDRLHGAIVSCDQHQITLQHSILGMVNLPLEQIRTINPAFYGFEFQFVGRAVHLGDEVKSNFRNSNPSGTSWKRHFQLETIPEGEQRIRVTANQLEPAHAASRATPLKARLLSGEFVSEVMLNEKRIAILNDHVSGLGMPEMPQEIFLRIPEGLLRQGKNTLEINLLPSRDAVPEYDDWELLGLSLDIKPNLANSASLPASGQRPQ